MPKPSPDSAFCNLLPAYGVPKRIVSALPSLYRLPEPYSLNNPPLDELKANGWVYLHGPTGTGKSTYAAYLMAAFLRARSRLGSAELEIAERLENDHSVPRGAGLLDRPCYRYVRATELLREMKSDFDSSTKKGQRLFDACLEARLLVLDDLTTQPSNWELNQLDLLIDYRYGQELKTIITSNQSLSKMGRVLGSDRIPGRIGEVSKVILMKNQRR